MRVGPAWTVVSDKAAMRRAGASVTMPDLFNHPPAMITVHHLNNSRSQRVLWLLEELGAALRDQALPARCEDDARAARAAGGPSARQVPGDHATGTRPSPNRARSSTTSMERYGNGRFAPAAGSRRGPALPLLGALRRGLGHAAAAAQAGVRTHQAHEDAVLHQAHRTGHRRQGAGHAGGPEPQRASSTSSKANCRRASGSPAPSSPRPTSR